MNNKLLLLVALVVLLFSQGCKVFQKSRALNMEPFSDNTSVLFNEAVKVSRPFQFKNLSTYTDVHEYETVKAQSLPLIAALKGIVYYSNQLAVISNSTLSEKQKNYQLALYLHEAFARTKYRARADSMSLALENPGAVLDEIRKAETYREGIAAADPIINMISIALFDRLDDIEAKIGDVISSFEDQIYAETEVAIKNYLRLKDLQNTTQASLSRLYEAQTSDITILDTLLQTDLILQSYITSTDKLVPEEFEQAEQYLFKRLERIDVLLKQLNDDKAEYLAKKEEISIWHAQVDEKLSIARNCIIVWAQSHRNLGQGIEVPPLFDVETIFDFVKPTISKAIDTVIF